MAGFELVCRRKGIRMTHQRYEIFRELAKYPGHPTVDAVFHRLRKRLKTISLDTIYRTILMFEKNGLIKRVQVLDKTARFDINLAVHHHLICTRCKKIEDFYWPEFDRMHVPKTIRGWTDINSRQVEIRGLCRECAAGQKRKQQKKG